MRVNLFSCTLVALCTAAMISGCSTEKQSADSGGAAAKTPKLIAYSFKQKRDAGESADPAAADGGDLVQAAPITANVNGELTSLGDRVWNDGVPFDGLRVVVQGGAFSMGLLGPPQECQVEVRSKDKPDQVGYTGSATFKQTESNAYTAIVPSVHCTDSIALRWSARALKAGASQYRVSVGPVDGSCRTVNFVHPCVVDAALNIRPAPTATPSG